VVLAEIRPSKRKPSNEWASPACVPAKAFPQGGELVKRLAARLTSYWKATGERAKAAREGLANQALGADRFRGFLKR